MTFRLSTPQPGKGQLAPPKSLVGLESRFAERLLVFERLDEAWPKGRTAIGGRYALHARFDGKRVNHSVAFKDEDACTNQAESYFSRLRRAEIGTHHHISGRYLHSYANEMAWREDNRRKPNGTQYLLVAAAAGVEGVLAAESDGVA